MSDSKEIYILSIQFYDASLSHYSYEIIENNYCNP